MTDMPTTHLRQAWPRPTKLRPIVILGAGSIVNDAHLPAYTKAGFPVAGIYDLDTQRARDTADKFQIQHVYESISQATSQPNVVFDIAVPPEHTYNVLDLIPSGSTVLMQKPMGKDLTDAKRIRQICRDKSLIAAVNFQLRFSPMMLAIRDAIDKKLLGSIDDIDFHLNLCTPWALFPFLKKMDRVEIQIHSVHYLDLIRSFLGEPKGVYARTVQHPDHLDLKSTKTSIILDYGNTTRCGLSINHNYAFGPTHEAATMMVQGSQGAARVTLGVLLDYPKGKPEMVEIVTKDCPWTSVPPQGRWFPDAFVGTMSNVQRFSAGEDEKLVSSVEDAYHTMALVEACYTSDASGATPIPK